MQLNVTDYMTTRVATAEAHHSMAFIRDLMEEFSVRHIPIVDQHSKVVGMVSSKDIAAAQISRFADLDHEQRLDLERAIPAKEIMTINVVTANTSCSMKRAGELMLECKISSLPIIDASFKLKGILTSTDFLRCVLEKF